MNKQLKMLTLYYLLNSQEVQGQTLKSAADGLGIYMGTAVRVSAWDDAQYLTTVNQEYDLITAENACKMNHIAKSIGWETWFDFNFYWQMLTGQ